MKIWLLKIGEHLPLSANTRKMRTLLLAESLAARGHEVIWWTSAFDHLRKAMLFNKDTDIPMTKAFLIKALKGCGYDNNLSVRRYIDHLIIKKKFTKAAKAMSPPDIIIASMPDHHLAYAAVKYAKRFGIPIVIDVRDPWPDIFLDAVSSPLLRTVLRLGLVEDFRRLKFLLQNADAIVAMMEPLLRWGLKGAKRAATWRDKVIPIGATPLAPFSEREFAPDFQNFIARLRNKKVITFVGTMGRYNNPSVLVRAAQLVNSRVSDPDNYIFVIAGTGMMYEAVKSEAFGINNVVLPGWLDASQMAAVLRSSSIGIIPCTETRDVFSNKAFTYLSAGLPLISSVEGELKDLIQSKQIGYNYESENEKELATLIISLSENRHLLSEMASNAKRLFDEQFDSNIVYKDFSTHVEAVANSKGNVTTAERGHNGSIFT